VKGIRRGLFYGNILGFEWTECGNLRRTDSDEPFGIQARDQCKIGVTQAMYIVKQLIPELVKISKVFMQGRWYALYRQSDTSVLKHFAQVFSEYFGFPCQSSFHQLLHNHPHLSSGAVQ
jgi:hypothetical protein